MIKIAVDFDGTLVERKGIPTEGKFEDYLPTEGALEAVRLFIKNGYDLYVCTVRNEDDWHKIASWMKKYGFPPLRITNIKEKNTSVYLDDRAIRFTNWQDFRKLYF